MATQRFLLAIPLLLTVLLPSCGDDSGQPEPEPPPIPVLSAPDSVLRAIEVIYKDRVRTAEEKAAEYAKLLAPLTPTDPGFVFHFTPQDVGNGLPETWGVDAEIEAHAGLFTALAGGQLHSLELRMTLNPARDLDPPQPGREDWQEIFATSIYLVLMFNPDDGLAVVGGQGRFLLAPAAGGTWVLAEWIELPRPTPIKSEATSWGEIKSLYGGDADPIPPPARPVDVIRAIEVIYSDQVRTAAERVAAYQGLLASDAAGLPDFTFKLQPADIMNGLPAAWGYATEVAVHEGIFGAQESGDVFSLTARLQLLPPSDPDPPVPGQEGWKQVFATNTYLRLMFSPNDGLEVNGGQAEFLVAPAAAGRWYVAEWQDLARPLVPGPGPDVEPSTWGSIKGAYLPPQ